MSEDTETQDELLQTGNTCAILISDNNFRLDCYTWKELYVSSRHV